MEELTYIQSKLNVPKNQYNDFGKYKYRSCEDILEALKPLLKEKECCLILEDEIVQIGERYYVKATARIIKTLKDKEQTKALQCMSTAYAREPEEKKEMDPSQITGSASSYARKYALNGLFAIDDTKDPDATNKHADEPKSKQEASKSSPSGTKTPRPISEAQRKKMYAMAKAKDSLSDNEIITFLNFLKEKGEVIVVDGEETISMRSASNIFDNFDKYFDEFTGNAFGEEPPFPDENEIPL